MKNILLTFLLCFAGFISSAQTLSVNPKLLFGSGSNSGGQDYICTVTNNTTDTTDINFKWKILKYNPPSAWLMSFCDPVNCIASIAVGQAGNFTISKGKSGQMHITYTFNNTPGSDTLRVSIQSISNPSNADTFTLYTNSWKTGINQVSQNHTISIYPNPVKDYLNVKFIATNSSTIEIYNIIG
ncbi:MAG: hypothetical protein WCG93_15515, partial [Paludibacter sp.]